MTDPETQTQPLLGQTAVNLGAPEQGPRSTRAYKVAGLTLVACVLILSQAAIAYFLLSQRSDIRNLEEQNNKMNTQLTSGRSASIPMRAHMSMNPAYEMMDTPMEEVASMGTEKTSTPLTKCQKEQAGLEKVALPGFHPKCNGLGLYLPQQCFNGGCWCVDPADGEVLPGVIDCNRSASSGDLMMLTKDVAMVDA
ncbi:HLA class II histocompatibility antigen gamma chain-like [Fundulus heteroclitus]|uniref:HLA class II histocompatibility antigen gamma chain-like n=1 Tax=Fundulus heteroclitus TaxID=8078 RepID=UPI00165AB936|nr:HLA class II histocompatibility antigen gamma chain-like [Fundulus heteroclitus]